jgi:monoterpene epsilon-lactone hydrolase
MGDAFLAADLASQVGRRTQAKVSSVDYRLAPEHPYPAAVDDALAAYETLLHDGIAPLDIAFAGESAGGGLAIATLVNARDHVHRFELTKHLQQVEESLTSRS